MGVLGKILIVFILLATGGFVYLATADWAKRQEWTYSAFRHELAIKGLPVEDGPSTGDPDTVAFPFDYENTTGLKQISKKQLNDIFSFPPVSAPQGAQEPAESPFGASGNPVASQLAEVRRVKDQANDLINRADGPVAKLGLLRNFLVNQARTREERERLLALTSDVANLAEARAELDRRFDAVLAPVAPTADPDAAARSAAARQRAIAHLLFHLDPFNANWHRRVLTVTGLETYAAAVEEQADRMGTMLLEVQSLIRDEQKHFEPAYRDLVERSRELARRLEEIVVKVNDQKFLINKHTVLRDKRKTEAETLQNELQLTREDVQKELSEQAALEQSLYDTQVRLGAALDAIVRLEEELRDLEVGE